MTDACKIIQLVFDEGHSRSCNDCTSHQTIKTVFQRYLAGLARLIQLKVQDFCGTRPDAKDLENILGKYGLGVECEGMQYSDCTQGV